MNPIDSIRIYGIRHHGPGSARRLMEAFHLWKPDCVLIECPSDGQEALDLIGDVGLVPPLAMLIYSPNQPELAAHLPFARFSPEWLAARYATTHHLPAIAMDLPWGIQTKVENAHSSRGQNDPFGLVAQTMGYSDTERWWEYYFEQVHGDEDLFPAIGQLMSDIRKEIDHHQDAALLLREAWMRRAIREYKHRGFQRIAVVCGAYHVPELDVKRFDEATDQRLLENHHPLAMASTWVPWTYHHLATRSGYGAGVLSPAWYDLLYEHQKKTSIHWMSRTAQLLRSKDLSVPPASVPAAVEMAEALATLRGMHQPGFHELEEAALATLAYGDDQWLEIIREKNLIGDRMGKVPDTIPRTPLQEDFHAAVRSARLKRAFETPDKVALDLDLRKGSNHVASILLHRLQLLDLPWGTWKSQSDRVKGSFRERWTLHWKKQFGMRLLEAGLWGLTIPEAVHAYILHRANETSQMSLISRWLRECLLADLPLTSTDLSHILMDRVAESQDIEDLMKTLTPLVYIHLYGTDDRSSDQTVPILLDRLIIRICVGLPGAFVGLSDEQAFELPGRIKQLLMDIRLLDRKEDEGVIIQTLEQVAIAPGIHPFVQGALTRFLVEEGNLSRHHFVRRLAEYLQNQSDLAQAASWCSGLMTGAEALLLHQPDLWESLNVWVNAIPEEDFSNILPLLRRTFSGYSPGAKRQIAIMLHRRQPVTINNTVSENLLTDVQKAVLLPVLRRWLFDT